VNLTVLFFSTKQDRESLRPLLMQIVEKSSPSVVVIFKDQYREPEINDRCLMERYRHTAEDFYI